MARAVAAGKRPIGFADQVGRVLTGPIAKIVPFGVFVELAPHVMGFLHLAELTDEPVETPDQLVDEGELITVEVTEVDLQRHRVRLGAAGGADRTWRSTEGLGPSGNWGQED
ncbi:S1 RNA-binding domain-containing protein [Streptomyces sp. NPDC001415]